MCAGSNLWENQPWNRDPGANHTRFNLLYRSTVTLPYFAHSLARLNSSGGGSIDVGSGGAADPYRAVALMFHGDFGRRDYGVCAAALSPCYASV